MNPAKPKLLVLTSTFPRRSGDTEPAFVFELCRRLQGRFEVRVLAPHAAGARTRETMDGILVIRYRYLPERWETLAYDGGIPAKLRSQPWRMLQVPFFLLAQVLHAGVEIIGWRADVIHAHWLIPQGLIAAAWARLAPRRPAVICTAHGADLYTLNRGIGRRIKAWVARKADSVTVVSSSMVEPALRLGADPATTEVASMGVDSAALFAPDGMKREPDLLLFAGRLVEKKGVQFLIEALARVRSRRPMARLVVAGDGPERAALAARARALGLSDAVEFRGAVGPAQLAILYRSAAMAVFPFVIAADGDQEGLGLVVIEAQSCECPVIASDVPAVRDTVVDGETGLLAPPGDAAALARCIDALIEDPERARRLGLGGRRAAVERFGWSAVAERYAQILLQARERRGC